MPTRPSAIERLKSVASRREPIEGAVPLPTEPTFPDAVTVTRHLPELNEPAAAALRLGIVHSYTSDFLANRRLR